MATTISRTPMVDDDGSGTTGTIINNAWKQELYSQIDAALAALESGASITQGTWTPIVEGDAGGSGVTYADRQAFYTRIGSNFVIATAYIVLSNKGTIAGNIRIAGLPFAYAGSGIYPILMGWWNNLSTAWASIGGIGDPGQARVLLRGVKGGAAGFQTPLAAADLSNDTVFVMQAAYRF